MYFLAFVYGFFEQLTRKDRRKPRKKFYKFK